jgi:hypothetical protein
VALTEHHRNALYQGLTQAVGDEEAVAAMLSELPAREADEPATKDFVRAELATQLAAQELRMDERFATKDFVRAELAAQLAAQELRMDEKFATKDFVHAEIAGVRKDMEVGFAEVRTEISEVERRLTERIIETASDLKTYIHEEMRRSMLWNYGALLTLLAAVVTAAKILQ